MGRAVCRKCWTWHGSGATVCPRCGAPLAAGNAQLPGNPPPPPSTVRPPIQPTGAPAARPAATVVSAHRPRRRRYLFIVTGALVLALVATLLVLQWSARAVSTDGTFSIQVPKGWVHSTGRSLPDSTASTSELMVLLGPISDGVQAHLVVATGFDQASCGLALPSTLPTATTETTVAGSAAVVAVCRTSRIDAEFLTVKHGSHIYVISFACASHEFARLRDGALHELLASWRWN
jgi:hypothetical protein